MYVKNYKGNIVLAAALALGACGGGKKDQGQAAMMAHMKATVVAVPVQPASYTVAEKFPATLQANNIVQLRSDVTGYLEAIRAKDGSNVSKGQVLYEIDKSRYSAAYGQVAASLQQAEADLALKKRDYDRYKTLLDHDAIAKQTVDQASTAVQTSEANVAAAKAAVARAGTDVNHAVMRAPVSGKIGIVQIKVGDIVNAGQTVINTLVNENPMYADFDIPQGRLQDFLKTQSDKKFFVQFMNGERYPQPGKVLTVNNAVDPQTGTVRVRLEFPNAEGLLKSGMSAVAVVQYATPATQLGIPAKAIIQNLSETSVYTLSPANVIVPKSIVPGAVTDTILIVTSGLNAGDRVVVEGLQKVRPGDTVNIAGAAPGKP